MFLVRNCDLLLMRTCYPKQAWIVVEVSAGLEQLTLHLSRVWTPMMSVSAVEELTYEEAFPELLRKWHPQKRPVLALVSMTCVTRIFPQDSSSLPPCSGKILFYL